MSVSKSASQPFGQAGQMSPLKPPTPSGNLTLPEAQLHLNHQPAGTDTQLKFQYRPRQYGLTQESLEREFPKPYGLDMNMEANQLPQTAYGLSPIDEKIAALALDKLASMGAPPPAVSSFSAMYPWRVGNKVLPKLQPQQQNPVTQLQPQGISATTAGMQHLQEQMKSAAEEEKEKQPGFLQRHPVLVGTGGVATGILLSQLMRAHSLDLKSLVSKQAEQDNSKPQLSATGESQGLRFADAGPEVHGSKAWDLSKWAKSKAGHHRSHITPFEFGKQGSWLDGLFEKDAFSLSPGAVRRGVSAVTKSIAKRSLPTALGAYGGGMDYHVAGGPGEMTLRHPEFGLHVNPGTFMGAAAGNLPGRAGKAVRSTLNRSAAGGMLGTGIDLATGNEEGLYGRLGAAAGTAAGLGSFTTRVPYLRRGELAARQAGRAADNFGHGVVEGLTAPGRAVQNALSNNPRAVMGPATGSTARTLGRGAGLVPGAAAGGTALWAGGRWGANQIMEPQFDKAREFTQGATRDALRQLDAKVPELTNRALEQFHTQLPGMVDEATQRGIANVKGELANQGLQFGPDGKVNWGGTLMHGLEGAFDQGATALGFDPSKLQGWQKGLIGGGLAAAPLLALGGHPGLGALSGAAALGGAAMLPGQAENLAKFWRMPPMPKTEQPSGEMPEGWSVTRWPENQTSAYNSRQLPWQQFDPGNYYWREFQRQHPQMNPVA